jgi:membrane protein DedA with SNARE-associated domain
MSQTTQFLISHGLPILFGVIFLEQMGLPLPGVPWLLAAGALSATGQFNTGVQNLTCFFRVIRFTPRYYGIHRQTSAKIISKR